MDAREVLGTVPLFKGIDSKHLDVLAKMAHDRSFAAGAPIVTQGEPGIAMFAIVSGSVDVVQGQEKLRTMGPGEVFGEISLLTDRPRTATVKATTPTECLVLTNVNIREALHSSPEMATHLLKTVAEMLIDAEGRASRV